MRFLGFAVAFLAVVSLISNWNHPCGYVGGIVEQTNLNFYLWDSLPQSVQSCLMDAGSTRTRPQHFISYFNTFWTILFEVQSRYIMTWPDAPSYNFELEVAEYLDVKRAQYVGSGDSALIAALQALHVGLNDEVLVPTHARMGIASSVSTGCGAIPIMADIDETLGLNPQTLSKYITPRTKGIIATHPCNIEAIKEFAKSKSLFVVEDVTGFFGSSVFGKKIGTFGDMAVSYVSVSGPLRNGGVGGLVWSNDTWLVERMGWAIENGLGAFGSERNLPSFKRSFGTVKTIEDEIKGINKDSEIIPFAANCFRSPSEWTAEFARNELLIMPYLNNKMVELKMAFAEALKPQYKVLLQREADPSGMALESISLILKEEKHVKLLQEYLQQNKVLVPDCDSWRTQYLPDMPSLTKKVSFHESGYPWIDDTNKKPVNPKDYSASFSIMKRLIRIKLSSYYTMPMIQWAAGKVNLGLDQIMQK